MRIRATLPVEMKKKIFCWKINNKTKLEEVETTLNGAFFPQLFYKDDDEEEENMCRCFNVYALNQYGLLVKLYQ